MSVAVVHAAGLVALAVVYWRTLVRGSDTSYVASPLWLDLPFVPQIAALQVVGLVCLVAWAVAMERRPSALVYGASVGFYACSMLWPVPAKRLVERPTPARALAASLPLWGAGACVLLLLHASTDTATRLLMVPVIVLAVVCDAVLWSAAAFRRGRG